MLMIVLIHSADDLSTNLASPAITSNFACFKVQMNSLNTPSNKET